MGSSSNVSRNTNRNDEAGEGKAEAAAEHVDYAAAADAFAETRHAASDDEVEHNDDESSSSFAEGEDNDDGKDHVDAEEQQDSDGSDDSESENEEEPDEEEESASDEDNNEEEEGDQEPDPAKFEQPKSATGEPCTFDLRNLVAMNTHQVNHKKLYAGKRTPTAESITIPASQMLLNVNVDEDELLEKATDGCTQLIAALWQLPKEQSNAGPMVRLPSFDDSRIPRALVRAPFLLCVCVCVIDEQKSAFLCRGTKDSPFSRRRPCYYAQNTHTQPPPEPKAETKWEKFARERGLPLNKEKRSQKVWDEATGSWMYRHGYKKANDEAKEWPIVEVKDGEDPYANPWEKQREAKRARVEKNVEQRMRNQERAGRLDKGTTTRVLKSREKSRKFGKEGGNVDRDSVPVGVPVDIKNSKSGNAAGKQPKRGKVSTLAALAATQRSTASLGRFDKMREGEPERKKVNDKSKKRKYETATDRRVLSGETARSLKVLKSVVEGGGVTRERDIRKGKYAKGETGYDYEFDDGLGPSTYKKKKGRSGMGKPKKMTKKRMK